MKQGSMIYKNWNYKNRNSLRRRRRPDQGDPLVSGDEAEPSLDLHILNSHGFVLRWRSRVPITDGAFISVQATNLATALIPTPVTMHAA